MKTHCKHYLPGFRGTCLTVCGLYVFLSSSLFIRGLMPSMAQFQVPAQTLASPHYADALLWVYVHMAVIGLMLGVIGWYATESRLQRVFARLMLFVHIAYFYLDLRSSDSPWGNALYKGPASMVPVLIGMLMCLLFAHLSICPAINHSEAS